MERLYLWCLSATLLSYLMQVSGEWSTYRAAVVEYHPTFVRPEAERVAENVKRYKSLIAEAKSKGAQIIVFPEGGLGANETRTYVPDPVDKIVPCDSVNSKFDKVLIELSCASKTSAIYSVVNLVEKRDCAPDDEYCPAKGFYVFNTNVAFDRKGTVIARYSKFNLFDEFFTDHTHDPEMSFFDTDFGVRFGTFICFDILFSTPAQRLVQQYHITDFVFTTYWFSELPFLTALQVQRGWAETNNVNLLASGVNYPSAGSYGSGIFNGKFGHIVQVMPVNTTTTRLLVADVPKIQKSTCSDVCQKEDPYTGVNMFREPAINSVPVQDEENYQLLRDQLYDYSSEVIKPGKTFDKTLCSRDLCCDFNVDVDALSPKSDDYTCRAMVFNGVRKFGQSFRGGVQNCGVVLCNGPHIMNCTSRLINIWGLFKFKTIEIKGNFKLKNSFQMPSTLTVGEDLKPLPATAYVFKRAEKDKTAEVSLELVWPTVDLQTFAIFGRDFTRDMEPVVPESGTVTVLPVSALLISLVAFLLFH